MDTSMEISMKRSNCSRIQALRWALLAALTISISLRAVADAVPAGDSVRGKALYQSCQACHSVDENDLGPRHRGVLGRLAGSVEDYSYSKALKQSGVIWSDSTLDQWLTNPTTMVPGTKMYFKLDDPQARADVIAYLKELK
jgi:cytochrome c